MMTYHDAMGVLDSEYDNLVGMRKKDVIIWLLEGFPSLSEEDAKDAVETVGAWE